MTGQTGHPAWCSQGPHCQGARRCADGSTEWAHATYPFVLRRADAAIDAHADVFLIRMDHVTADDEHLATAAIVLTADGSLTAEEARRIGRALVRAADQLDEAVGRGAPSTP